VNQLTIYIANASCGGSLSCACGACAWRFSLCGVFLGNP
jgi:hypothetical protein